jgi:hypothetical protein
MREAEDSAIAWRGKATTTRMILNRDKKEKSTGVSGA